MDNISKEYYKKLVSNNQYERLIEELFLHISNVQSVASLHSINDIYDDLILLSGKLSGFKQETLLGIIRKEDYDVERTKIGRALISLINRFPEKYFEVLSGKKEISKDVSSKRERIKEALSQNKFEYDIFVSFARQNAIEAKSISEKLRGYGLKIFLSDEALKANVGESFFEKISYALKNSKDFVLVWSIHAQNSQWVKTEYETFFNEFSMKQGVKRRLIVYKTKNFDPQTVPLLLRKLQYANDTEEIISTVTGQNFTQPSKPLKEETIPSNPGNTYYKKTVILYGISMLSAILLGYMENKYGGSFYFALLIFFIFSLLTSFHSKNSIHSVSIPALTALLYLSSVFLFYGFDLSELWLIMILFLIISLLGIGIFNLIIKRWLFPTKI